MVSKEWKNCRAIKKKKTICAEYKMALSTSTRIINMFICTGQVVSCEMFFYTGIVTIHHSLKSKMNVVENDKITHLKTHKNNNNNNYPYISFFYYISIL